VYVQSIPETTTEAPPAPTASSGAAPTTTTAASGQTPAAPATTGAPRNLFEAAAAASQRQQTQPGGGDAGAESASELERLRDDPAFTQLRNLVRDNPALLQPFLQQLGQSNPHLMELIARNPDAFARLLAPEAMGDDEGDEALAGGPNSQYIEVSDQDRANIDQLAGMGFDRQIVIQAYIACDRNTEFAASYLLEHGQEWEDDLGAGPTGGGGGEEGA
jgi:UV excision repair protein RAD23